MQPIMKAWTVVGLAAIGLLGVALLWQGLGKSFHVPAPSLREPVTVDEVLVRWTVAYDGIRNLRGSQRIVDLRAGGAGQSGAGNLRAADPRGLLRATDEVYERQGDDIRYRVTAQFAVGDEITLWDGAHAARYRAWLHEIYRPLPESYAVGAYWVDDLDELSLLTLLAPVRGDSQAAPVYHLIGIHDLDGREVVELQVKPGTNIIPFGTEGTRIYLDRVSFLPYRVVTPPTRISGGVEIERTVTQLSINVGVDDDDFVLSLPPETITIYEKAPRAPKLQIYPSVREAAQQVGFVLYLPGGSQPREVYTMYMVEQDGWRSPVVAVEYSDGVTVLAGRYLPQYGREALDERVMGPPQAIEIDGQAAILRAGRYGRSAVILERQGTQIEISGTLDGARALELARTLQPVS